MTEDQKRYSRHIYIHRQTHSQVNRQMKSQVFSSTFHHFVKSTHISLTMVGLSKVAVDVFGCFRLKFEKIFQQNKLPVRSCHVGLWSIDMPLWPKFSSQCFTDVANVGGATHVLVRIACASRSRRIAKRTQVRMLIL